MARSCFTLSSHRVFLFTLKQINKGNTKMKKQKIRNKSKYITEPIYNIALYYCNRNYGFHKRNSKRTLSSVIVITDYLCNVSKKVSEKHIKVGNNGF